ncbi:hypothetical protein BX616_000756 [Lobosporangium transversale]|uniref:Clasp N terminal-domain-containing protein n=1 Tax=Lobosporangium transversale TaxID=64571 RepID=A0A1Y2GLW0_9FUNG|nr:clasp N terminal-domain-containing protein [Lobosporangium transversale]KAF9906322.1 hypothetical protein BX616_000756 [Lobosporangium transversale]ORZ14945.1 clasp N terminal-domain-containing protein [Lobosporangium transversale]|eukprot:XP_021881077.1 clasp N terminal-domain-containing protein [Lobosporangium transversale]
MLATTSQHLNYHELDNILSQPETEHNWAAKEATLKTLGAACHSGIAQNNEYIVFIKNHRKAFAECLLTERTRLSGAACELVEKLSTAMGRDFGIHFPDLFTNPLLKVCARTNKVMVSRSLKALNSMINAGNVVPLPRACSAFATNNKTLRIACIGIIASCITQFSSQELEPHLHAFEPILKEGVSDAAPEVRDTSRKSYKVYAEKFPERSQILTATLPANVLKYLLPDTRSSGPQSRATVSSRLASSTGRSIDGGELPRHQSSRELTAGLNRPPSRVGPVRSRTVSLVDHSSSSSSSSSSNFKPPTHSSQHTSQSSHSYLHHGTQAQQSHGPLSQQHLHHHTTHTLTRNHGPASRTGSLTDLSEGSSGHGAHRLSSQRNRSFSSNALTTTQRSPSINLATNGGPQRVVPPAPYSADGSKTTRPSSSQSRFSKTEPVSKSNRASVLSNHPTASADREHQPMSASERAKAYAANLKAEMASRRAAETHMRMGLNGATRRATADLGHSGFHAYGSISSSVSASSNASTASTSTATSTTTVSPASSSSTSPTTVHPPNHDYLFSTFRSQTNSQLGSSPPESCPSPEARHSTPPMSQPPEESLAGATGVVSGALETPLSPTFMAQVSLDTSSNNSMEDAHPSEGQPSRTHSSQPQYHGLSGDDSTANLAGFSPAPLSPLSPRSPHSPHSLYSPLQQQQQDSVYVPPSPNFEPNHSEERNHDFNIVGTFVGIDKDHDHDDKDHDHDQCLDHNMSIPDHESLFGNTENYLQAEQEILELQKSLRLSSQPTGKEGDSMVEDHNELNEHFMDEDPLSLDQAEEMEVKAYVERYGAAMEAEAEEEIIATSVTTTTVTTTTVSQSTNEVSDVTP